MTRYENKQSCEVSPDPLESSQKCWENLTITGLVKAEEFSPGSYKTAGGVQVYGDNDDKTQRIVVQCCISRSLKLFQTEIKQLLSQLFTVKLNSMGGFWT